MDFSRTTLSNVSSDGFYERPYRLDMDPASLARYAFALHFVNGHRVADLCCGTGDGTRLIAAMGAERVIGIDISELAIEEAKKRNTDQRLSYYCNDVAAKLPIDELDLAICFEGIEHLSDPEALLKNIADCLDEDGVALISTPNAAAFEGGFSGNPYHVREYQLKEFEYLLSKYFGKIKMFFQWWYDNPFDREWSLSHLSRLLLPISIKRRLEFLVKRNESRIQGSSSSKSNRVGRTSLTYRPMPFEYLQFPGLRGAQPAVWLAVCESPKKDD